MNNHAETVTLEERLTHQEQMIDDLSSQLAKQWEIIARLEARIGGLTTRFGALEDSIGDAPIDVKPPHY